MHFLAKLCAFGLLSLPVLRAQEPLKAQRVNEEGTEPTIAVKVKTSFPDSELFGVKAVNDKPLTAVVTYTNEEAGPVSVRFIAGALWTLDAPGQPAYVFRNLSMMKLEGSIAPGASQSYNYKFTTSMHPQSLRLILMSLISNHKGEGFGVTAFNETISVVEPPQSIFDPQILFLYVILIVAFAGTAYFVYNTWVASLFPQQKGRGGKSGAGRGGAKTGQKSDTAEPIAEVSSTTTSAKTYDESWIPAHHIQRPEAKRSRSGTPSGKGGAKSS